MTTTAKPQDVKPESDDQYCEAEKATQRPDTKNTGTTQNHNQGEIIWGWRKGVSTDK